MGGSQQGRGLRVSGMCFLAIQIKAHVLGHLFGGQRRALGVVVQRWVLGMEAAAQVGGRVDEDLAGQLWQGQRHDGGQVAARAVASHAHPPGVDAECVGVLQDPARGRDAVVRRLGPGQFRRQRVVHRDHDSLRGMCQATADAIVRVQITHAPAAAVEVDEGC